MNKLTEKYEKAETKVTCYLQEMKEHFGVAESLSRQDDRYKTALQTINKILRSEDDKEIMTLASILSEIAEIVQEALFS